MTGTAGAAVAWFSIAWKKPCAASLYADAMGNCFNFGQNFGQNFCKRARSFGAGREDGVRWQRERLI
jgi:hypothetical protein